MANTSRIIRRRFGRATCWLLAILAVVLSFGNPSDLVLCIEDDGGMAIEAPVEQAACREKRGQGQSLAAANLEPQSSGTGGCVDIPLNLGHGALHRRCGSSTSASRIQTGLTLAGEVWIASAAPLRPINTGRGGDSPTSGAIESLRTTVLRV